MDIDEFKKQFSKALETKSYINITTNKGTIKYIEDIGVFALKGKNKELHIKDRLSDNLREYFRVYLVIAILASAAIGGIVYPPISLLTLIGSAVFVFWYVGGFIFFR